MENKLVVLRKTRVLGFWPLEIGFQLAEMEKENELVDLNREHVQGF